MIHNDDDDHMHYNSYINMHVFTMHKKFEDIATKQQYWFSLWFQFNVMDP